MSDQVTAEKLAKQLREALQANRSWKDQYERYSRDSEKLVGDLKSEKEHLKRELDRQKEESIRLREVAEGGRKLEEKDREIGKLKSQFDAVAGKLRYLENRYDQVVVERDQLRDARRRFEAEKQQMEGMIQSSRRGSEEVAVYKAQVTTYQEDFQREREEKKELQRKNRQLHEQLQRLSDGNRVLQGDADALRRQLAIYDPYFRKGSRNK
eukprot:m.292900 g.292900  ORF g.292900 m.292900 type:complete len:210 (+) comp40732_c1_seq32:332-961(+)